MIARVHVLAAFAALLSLAALAGCGACGGASTGTRQGASTLETEQDVREAYEKAIGHELGEDGCIDRPSELPGIVLAGTFAHDRGCALGAVFVDGDYVEPDRAESAALAHLGWADASPDRRRELARLWVEDVLHAFGGRLLDDPNDDFERADTPAFAAPEATSGDDGSVTVVGWRARRSGMQPESSYDFLEYRFAADGELSAERRASFTVPHDAPPAAAGDDWKPVAKITPGAFLLDLELETREHSRDSNWRHYEVLIQGHHVHYDGPFGRGRRGPHPTRDLTFQLSPTEEDELHQKLRDLELLQTVTEVKEETPNAPYRSIDATARLVLDGKEHELRLQGAVSAPRDRGPLLEHQDLADGLDRLGDHLKELAESKADTPAD